MDKTQQKPVVTEAKAQAQAEVAKVESNPEAIRAELKKYLKPEVLAAIMAAIEGMKTRKSKDSFVIGTNNECLGICEWPSNRWIPVKDEAGEMLFGAKQNLTFGLSNMSIETTNYWTELNNHINKKLQPLIMDGLVDNKTKAITADLFKAKKQRIDMVAVCKEVMGDLFAPDKPLDTAEKRGLYKNIPEKVREKALAIMPKPKLAFDSKEALIKYLVGRGNKVDYAKSKAEALAAK